MIFRRIAAVLPQLLASWYKTRYRLQRFRRIFAVHPEELVLDIGAGDSPFAPADVLCEKFPWDDTERTAGFRHDRPLVVGDVEALPFRDKAFDFIYCCHVLEHTFDPGKAILELMRVGKRGYIEMPTALFEKAIKSDPSHLWFVRLENGQLIFTPKPKGILDPEINEWHARLHLKDPLYDAFYYAHVYSLFHVGLFWETTIPYQIAKDVSGIDGRSAEAFKKGTVELSLDRRTPLARRSLAGRWKDWTYRRRKKQFKLEELLACPVCRGPLEKNSSEFFCAGCEAAYPLLHDIPMLLKEASTPLAVH